MPSQSIRALETQAASTSGRASDRSSGGGRGNAAAAERLEGVQTGREPADYAVDGAPVTHAPALAGEAVNAGDQDVPNLERGTREVRILRSEEDPLRVSGSTPAEQELYEERPLGQVCDPAWQAVEGVRGSLESPIRTEALLEGSLFVGGEPSVMDVHQGQVGDCYLLAGLLGLVAANPQRIAEMVRISGQTAVVSLFRHDDAASAWVPTAITVNLELAHFTDEGGRLRVQGAGFRRGGEPARSDWYAAAPFDDLWVCEDAYYEAAMWVSLIEKAYARFAERYGQYGGFVADQANAAADANGGARSGYEVISGGQAQPIMQVLLGESAGVLPVSPVAWSAGESNVEKNELAILRLLGQRGENVIEGEKSVMTVSIGEQKSITRLGKQADFVLGHAGIREYPDFERTVQRLAASVEGWSGAPDGPEKDTLQAEIVTRSREMAAPGAWPVLRSNRAGGEYRALDELLLVVANLGADGGPGQRHVYAKHEYAVMGSTFRDAKGAELGVTNTNVREMLSRIDGSKSQVQLRNPHGRNSPNPEGSAGAGEDDGAFTLTLDQFFRSFGSQQSVVLK